ncbi:glycosyltransferase involved in cell wall biogenesis [Leptolyngbya boryana NIES-2135]|jgi:rSAM/selenodomain-associated transferase 2|uniref:4,4'-diaponeurosporenoate glycosyltransferase n=1 Tax=Leptolyngbya boryana NIES-2135 TaxID=1973484 RepID=A0A1Z4JIJ9_LEPBY|nr:MULTISPECIES: TIGR04283 family arsenosugar biosynthesis glycosyltransferase [Leptolyngbya]BAY56367.1 glycosyltransferase involved in cell wall biogenesis [Leptolyngbya boryana NIES-2135]MBD2366473.1 TIGR04283 family arsenosugar biosynthesis glycosyltransferase [Leptolyngbya sp. FACHB-161]MBD2372652.1 TIGR04283 family arsenosugar biosynthesis glycosyltransferase [Leptolyngbya sp. FACHB-238]MBD2397075.1 TIGR04283 family arsenosugar biosynthesis glycosyltransferase [Leptolyngbya sp. FACHB-239]
MKISIVIPVLNEARHLPNTLSIQATDIEMIIVDGGSQDETVAIAQSFGVKVLQSNLGRATQMNAGAKVASGEILLFLHADTRLPDGFDQMIRDALKTAIAGAFQLSIDAHQPGIRWIEQGVNWRSRYLQLPYGDQALFLRTETFHKISGFPDLPIMEDFEFVRTLQQLGKIVILPKPVITSGRRWQKLGVFRTTIVNQIVVFAYLIGISPTRIQAWYRSGLRTIR